MSLLLKTGCLNGGGQIKPKPGQSPKDLIELLEAAYQENVSTFSRIVVYGFPYPIWNIF